MQKRRRSATGGSQRRRHDNRSRLPNFAPSFSPDSVLMMRENWYMLHAKEILPLCRVEAFVIIIIG
jgi:hypothetical protein